ncbi:diphosphomevalonate decarboxylase [Ancylomarina euxinus]|uniref:Diphosphomevalonate decarboxylase n=1 Tax=Ancylomarina euxinus TaxID=2283627 RepID=A0A425XZK9_9BACT|nr:diphosphomevalonate decarboxylase [Ancylomarina euxinus]MCZ4695486.1 diphosphomevalonate decarboxylase [Ancylomarina euxinus]MUP15696.1 diphosphomevalonate decarboxylase [Ancylomarina euxinus]RRG20689.1 diphosphomevalonate decarboxylase [Ancylomarina euxinus]
MKNTIIWESPSNIALVKYWGKMGVQLPCNPSLSMSLSASVSRFELTYSPKKPGEKDLTYLFEGKENKAFEEKLSKFIDSVSNDLPCLTKYQLKISSSNTFPHSAGIASSASAMSALALCLCSMQEAIDEMEMPRDFFLQKASRIARLGSGSASRSVFGQYAIWGEMEGQTESSNYFAIPFKGTIHPTFQDLQDTILMIDSSPKKVSSTAGHELMVDHPYADARFQQARLNMVELLDVLEQGDFDKFTHIVENEALSLHGLMMSSNPSYTLLKPNTLIAIERIKNFREKTQIPLCFTLDAGPNIHLLYPKADEFIIQNFIKQELIELLEEGKYIQDGMGNGPKRIK